MEEAEVGAGEVQLLDGTQEAAAEPGDMQRH
jgi:hypothetical protein